MLKLFNHQKIALSYMRLNDGFYLNMEQGTGKTIPTLKRILELAQKDKISNALVIAPKSALGAWERDIELFEHDEQKLLLKVITRVNYDKVWRGAEQSPYWKQWDLIVCDEAHLIKNRTSRRAKFILKIACNAKYKYALSGTMIGNGQLENVWSQFCFLDPYIEKGKVRSRIFGTYSNFENRYCIVGRFYRPVKYINISECQDIIAQHCYRVKKIDCLDLPEKLPDELRDIELQEKVLYKKLFKESALIDYEVLAENPLARMIKLRQMCSGFIVTEDGLVDVKCEKLQVLEEMIEDLDKKLVIFAEFKYSIKQIKDLLDKLKIKYVVLDGDQKNKSIWRDFQKDESIRIIICQYQSASTGIDLFASDTIIYYEPTTRSNILEQSRDRIHRTGQKEKCSYIHLITKGTIEEQIYESLSKYSDFSEKLFVEYLNTYTKSYNQ